MNKKIKVIGLIPAKENSSGLKNKNLRKINNLSLVELAIINAKKSKKIDEIYLSSDSDKILKIGTKLGINIVKRKKNLCAKSTPANLVILDFLKNNFDRKRLDHIIVYLQPTSPFRNHKHIDSAIEKFLKYRYELLCSVNEQKNFFKSLIKNNNFLSPYFSNKLISQNRQTFKKIYSPNGAIYVFNSKDFLKKNILSFKNCGFFLMNKIESIDIDSYEDLQLAKYLSKKYLKM